MYSHRLAIVIAFVLLLIGSGRIISTYNVFNHTIDEPLHLAAGMEWIDGHKYTYEDLHPPLSRISGALGAHLAGAHWTQNPNGWYEGFDLLGRDEHYDRVLFYGRLGILPFFWIAGVVVFLAASRIAGPWAGVAGVFFLSTTPSILAHSGLITTDMALAACLGAAMLASCYWWEKPTLVRSAAFGICFALATLSKFSALIFLASIWTFMFIIYLLMHRPTSATIRREVEERALPLLGALGLSFFVVWATYFFTEGEVEFLHTHLPAPAFFNGLHSLWLRNKESGTAFLFGERSSHGFWYYFPTISLIKTPLAMVILLGASILLLFIREHRSKIVLPLAFIISILLPAMATRINIGSRHILPIYLGWSVLCGVIVFYMLRPGSPLFLKLAAAALLVWQGATGIIMHPDYLAYTNEVAGDRPELILSDSDIDWGQDMKRLGTRLQQLGIKEINMAIFNREYLRAGHPFPKIQELPGGKVPPPGWSAVSLTRLSVDNMPEWGNDFLPKEKIGRSIHLYYFPTPDR